MEFLNTVPNHQEDFEWFKTIINISGILLGTLLIIVGSILSSRHNRMPLLISASGAVLLLLNMFSIFRMLYPEISHPWLLGVAALLSPFIMLVIPLFTRFSNYIEDKPAYLAICFILTGFPIAIAYALDKINEQLASIPATWGALIIILLGIFAFTSSN